MTVIKALGTASKLSPVLDRNLSFAPLETLLLLGLLGRGEDSDDLDVDASEGEVRVGVLDENGRPISGFARSTVVSGDRTDVVVEWIGSGTPKAKSVQLRFEMTSADLYSYWLR